MTIRNQILILLIGAVVCALSDVSVASSESKNTILDTVKSRFFSTDAKTTAKAEILENDAKSLTAFLKPSSSSLRGQASTSTSRSLGLFGSSKTKAAPEILDDAKSLTSTKSKAAPEILDTDSKTAVASLTKTSSSSTSSKTKASPEILDTDSKTATASLTKTSSSSSGKKAAPEILDTDSKSLTSTKKAAPVIMDTDAKPSFTKKAAPEILDTDTKPAVLNADSRPTKATVPATLPTTTSTVGSLTSSIKSSSSSSGASSSTAGCNMPRAEFAEASAVLTKKIQATTKLLDLSDSPTEQLKYAELLMKLSEAYKNLN